MAIIISFSGPLNPGVVLIVCPSVLLVLGASNFRKLTGELFFVRLVQSTGKIPSFILVSFLCASALSLLSLYIGSHNLLTQINAIPLADRFTRLPDGFFNQFNTKLGFPLLIGITSYSICFLKSWKFRVVYFVLLACNTHEDTVLPG